MDNDALRDYLEGKDFVYDEGYPSYFWVEKRNPGHPYCTVPRDNWIDPEVVREICDKLGVPVPPGI